MKIIDLLNKIANGEEVRFEVLDTGDIFSLKKGEKLYNETYEEEVDWHIDEDWLNYGVKIIEEKKIPEKLDQTLNRTDIGDDYYRYIMENRFTINEIIDYLNSKGE